MDVGTVVASFGALLISVATYFTTRPRLRIEFKTAIELGSVVRNAARVEVVNAGRAPGHIRSVALVSTDGSFARSAPTTENMSDPTAPVMGPGLPKVLAPTESATWSFDYAEIRRDVAAQVRHEPVVLRARVHVGHRTVESSWRLAVGGPDAKVQTRRVRFRKWVGSLSQPRPQVWVTRNDADRRAGVLTLEVKNYGRAFCRRVVLYMVAEDSDGAETLVDGAPIFKWRWLRPGGVRRVRPSLDVATAPAGGAATHYWWRVSTSRGPGAGNEAPTLETIRNADQQLLELGNDQRKT